MFLVDNMYGLKPVPFKGECSRSLSAPEGIFQSRMKIVNASKLDRKSGVRSGERGAPVRCCCWANPSMTSKG